MTVHLASYTSHGSIPLFASRLTQGGKVA